MRYEAETLDLSRVGAPSLVETDPLKIKDELLTEFVRLWNEARLIDPTLPEYTVQSLRTDPAVILTDEFTYGETHLRQAVNDAADALRLATAQGPDLDHIANTYHNTARLVLDPGDPNAQPPRAPVYEDQESYRQRAQLAPEAYPEMGLTPGGYIYRVLRLFGHRIKGVRPLKREGGKIDLIILPRDPDPVAAAQLVRDLQSEFEKEDAEQLTDIVSVRLARLIPTTVKVVLFIPDGPDGTPLKAAAIKALVKLAAEREVIGETLHMQAIGAVAKVGPTRHVKVVEPLVDIGGERDAVPFVTAIEAETEIERE